MENTAVTNMRERAMTPIETSIEAHKSNLTKNMKTFSAVMQTGGLSEIQLEQKVRSFLGNFSIVLKENPLLAMAPKPQILAAAFTTAQYNLDPNQTLQEIWYIPFQNKDGSIKVTIFIGVNGWKKLSMRMPGIKLIHTHIVYNDQDFNISLMPNIEYKDGVLWSEPKITWEQKKDVDYATSPRKAVGYLAWYLKESFDPSTGSKMIERFVIYKTVGEIKEHALKHSQSAEKIWVYDEQKGKKLPTGLTGNFIKDSAWDKDFDSMALTSLLKELCRRHIGIALKAPDECVLIAKTDMFGEIRTEQFNEEAQGQIIPLPQEPQAKQIETSPNPIPTPEPQKQIEPEYTAENAKDDLRAMSVKPKLYKKDITAFCQRVQSSSSIANSLKVALKEEAQAQLDIRANAPIKEEAQSVPISDIIETSPEHIDTVVTTGNAESTEDEYSSYSIDSYLG